ncbi:hypothetical protein GCM10010172_70850 [Paractinoplanes ferrugineus]|uniref:Uncharacterized protein n=1 Tax=Paractinoplanes ferrugineus TaxID=113564 RepID=A0A919MJQ2_9ACTN|nr:hypothetical protein Afe05nite_68100 [Actinoplanes ferrugineus]
MWHSTASFRPTTSARGGCPGHRSRFDLARQQVRDVAGHGPDGRAKRGGIEVGARTAADMIAARVGDGAFGDATWTASPDEALKVHKRSCPASALSGTPGGVDG